MLVKTQFALTKEAVDVINAYATERKRGEWISKIIVDYAALLATDDIKEECGIFERLDRRLSVIERRTALLVGEKLKGET